MIEDNNEELEFEQIEGTDLRVSKQFQTKDNDTIRVAFTNSRTAIITSNKKSDLPDVIVHLHGDMQDGDIPGTIAKKGFWGRVWDTIKNFVKGLFGGGVDVSSNCKLVSETVIDISTGKELGRFTGMRCNWT